MSIIYNNTTIENITYNGTNIDTVNYNNTEVFSGTPKTLTVKKGGYITSIIINGTTYTSNTTLSIKPGTSVTLNCNIESNYSDDMYNYTFSFYRWTGYTTNTNKSFTFTMPNQDITYTANGNSSTSFVGWPSSGNISDDRLYAGIYKNNFDTSLVGRKVAIKEGTSTTRNWIIIRVNSNSYDLWCNINIEYSSWKVVNNSVRWIDQPLTAGSGYNTNSDNPRYLCEQFRINNLKYSKLKDYLRTGLNADCGSDKVVILSARQLGLSEKNYTFYNDSNSIIPYFNDKTTKYVGYTVVWTTTISGGANSTNVICLHSNAYTESNSCSSKMSTYPAIRVGR